MVTASRVRVKHTTPGYWTVIGGGSQRLCYGTSGANRNSVRVWDVEKVAMRTSVGDNIGRARAGALILALIVPRIAAGATPLSYECPADGATPTAHRCSADMEAPPHVCCPSDVDPSIHSMPATAGSCHMEAQAACGVEAEQPMLASTGPRVKPPTTETFGLHLLRIPETGRAPPLLTQAAALRPGPRASPISHLRLLAILLI